MVISCAISSTMNKQKMTKIAEMTTVKKLIKVIKESGSFESTAKCNWQSMYLDA